MKTTSGFILIITLILCLCSSLILLFLLQLLTATNNQLTIEKKDQAITESIHLKMRLLTDNVPTTCQLPIIPIYQVRKNALDWFRAHACYSREEDAWYYYEFLTEDACAATLIKNNHAENPARYYRLTLFHHDVIWQTTFVKSKETALSCQGVIHFVQPGIQSERRFNVDSRRIG